MSVAEIIERAVRWKIEHPAATKLIVTQAEYDVLDAHLKLEARYTHQRTVPLAVETPRTLMVHGLELEIKP